MISGRAVEIQLLHDPGPVGFDRADSEGEQIGDFPVAVWQQRNAGCPWNYRNGNLKS